MSIEGPSRSGSAEESTVIEGYSFSGSAIGLPEGLQEFVRAMGLQSVSMNVFEQLVERDKSKAKTWVSTTLHRKFRSPARMAEFLAELDEIFRPPLTLLCLQLHSAKEMLRPRMTAGPSSVQKNILRMKPGTLKNQHG